MFKVGNSEVTMVVSILSHGLMSLMTWMIWGTPMTQETPIQDDMGLSEDVVYPRMMNIKIVMFVVAMIIKSPIWSHRFWTIFFEGKHVLPLSLCEKHMFTLRALRGLVSWMTETNREMNAMTKDWSNRGPFFDAKNGWVPSDVWEHGIEAGEKPATRGARKLVWGWYGMI